MPLDETTLRRDDFAPGIPVQMADGTILQLRKPVVRFIPHDSSPSGYRTAVKLDNADRFQELLDAREAVFNDDRIASVGALAGPELAIGKALMLANYDLTAEQVAAMLQFGYDDDDPEGSGIRQAVIDIALGRGGPKPPPDTDDSSRSVSGD